MIPSNVYHGAPLVPLRQEGEEHLHLVAVLLHVSDVVEDDGLEAVELLQFAFEREVALGGEQSLHEQIRGREEHRVSAPDELMADGAHQVSLSSSR